MDGRNSTGRKISLLNDSSDVASAPIKSNPHAPSGSHQRKHNNHQHHHPIQLPSLIATVSSHSRTPSCASTPSLSPQTPQLVRCDSSDSRLLTTPSPLTPSFGFDHLAAHTYQQQHQQKPVQQNYYIPNHQQRWPKMDEQNPSMYPPIPEASGSMPSAYPMPPQMSAHMPPQQGQQIYRSSTSPASEPSRVSTVSAASNNNANAKAAPKKNHYPCPMAKSIGCTDFFTTSGHAARHAKKHTGKKDAFCPECNKAFTRKDNMEQHRRTHQNGRGTSRTNDDAKVKKPTKPAAKKSTIKPEQQPMLEAALEQQLAEQQTQPQIVPHVPAPVQVQEQPQLQQLQQATDPAMMMASGPYFLNGLDSGPVPALPMPTLAELGGRPTLQRSNFTSSLGLDYMPSAAQMMLDQDLNYSYPSPGLSHGLNSLALAASEHRRLSEEKDKSPSSSDSFMSNSSP